MPSDLWKYSINSIKSEIKTSKLDSYLQKQVKKTIKKKLLTLGTQVFVIGNKKLIKKHIQETPGLDDIKEKLQFMRKSGTVIDVDRDVGHSKVCFKDNRKAHLHITFQFFIPVRLFTVINCNFAFSDTLTLSIIYLRPLESNLL